MTFVDISKGAKKSNGDSPPKGKSAPRAQSSTLTIPQIRKGLGELFDMASAGFLFAGDMHCSLHFSESPQREALIGAWCNLAERNLAVKRIFSRLLTGSAYTEVTVATIAFFIPVAQHHGLYPDTWINPFSLDPSNIQAMADEAEAHANGKPDPRG